MTAADISAWFKMFSLSTFSFIYWLPVRWVCVGGAPVHLSLTCRTSEEATHSSPAASSSSLCALNRHGNHTQVTTVTRSPYILQLQRAVNTCSEVHPENGWFHHYISLKCFYLTSVISLFQCYNFFNIFLHIM